jgi:hypothetical protein
LTQDKEGESTNLNLKQIIKEGGKLRESLAFASIYNEHLPDNCCLKGNYIEVRNNNGVLKRRKCIV